MFKKSILSLIMGGSIFCVYATEQAKINSPEGQNQQNNITPKSPFNGCFIECGIVGSSAKLTDKLAWIVDDTTAAGLKFIGKATKSTGSFGGRVGFGYRRVLDNQLLIGVQIDFDLLQRKKQSIEYDMQAFGIGNNYVNVTRDLWKEISQLNGGKTTNLQTSNDSFSPTIAASIGYVFSNSVAASLRVGANYLKQTIKCEFKNNDDTQSYSSLTKTKQFSPIVGVKIEKSFSNKISGFMAADYVFRAKKNSIPLTNNKSLKQRDIRISAGISVSLL